MKIEYLGETSFLELTKNEVDEILSVEKGWYRIAADVGEDYHYPPE